MHKLLAFLILATLSINAQAMLRIEVCGGANDVRQCKAGVDEITNSGGTGDVTIGCAVGDPNCTVKDQNIKINPLSPYPTPAGWTAPVPPSLSPTPPTTVPETAGATSAHPDAGYASLAYTTQAAACGNSIGTVYHDSSNTTAYAVYGRYIVGQHPAVLNNSVDLGSCDSTPENDRVARKALACPAGTSYLHPAQCTAAATCPAGYTGPSGGNCTLSNSSAVVKPSDNKCLIKRIGNTFSGDTQDPDCSVQPNVSVNGAAVTITPVSSSVESGKIQFQTDGSGSIEMSIPNADGTTTRHRATFGPPDGTTGQSITTGTSSETYKGTGTSTGTTPMGELPTDYNRETTQQAILDKLTNGIKIDETGTPETSDLAAQKGLLDDATTARIQAIEGNSNVTNLGLGLEIVWPVSSCVDPSYAIPGTGKNLVVPMCAKRPDIQLAMNWLVGILGAFLIFQIGTAAVGGKS